MSISIKTGTVKYPADRVNENPYEAGQQQQNLVCTMADGSEERLYFQAYRKPHAVLQRGEPIQILYDRDDKTGKVKRRLVVENQEQIMQRPAREAKPQEHSHQYQQKAAKPKQSADLFITERLAIYNQILERVKNCKFAIELTDSDKSDIATSIIIEGTRNHVDFKELLVTQDHIVPNNAPVQEVFLDYPTSQIEQSYEGDPAEIPF